MFSNDNAYQAEVRYRHQQLHRDLARRQQAKLARRNRDTATHRTVRAWGLRPLRAAS
jgi:hypothetical protein